MPDRHSKAGHVPERTCVICRTKTAAMELQRFELTADKKIIYTATNAKAGRGYYVCPAQDCRDRLDKWLLRKIKHRKARA